MKTYIISVGIIKFKENILILKRSTKKRFDPNKWEFVSGFIKDHETAEETILREIKEETNLEGKLVKSGKVFEVEDSYGRWIIIPFLVDVSSDNVKISSEHTEHRWIKVNEIKDFETVADLEKDLKQIGLI